MKKFTYNGRVRLVLFVFSLIVLSACATSGGVNSSIEKRVDERWNLLFSGDLAGAYEYLSPGYRSSVSSIQYQRAVLLQQVKWTDATYIESDCSEVTCKVKILLGYSVYGAVPGAQEFKGQQTVVESWVLVDDNWYMVPKK